MSLITFRQVNGKLIPVEGGTDLCAAQGSLEAAEWAKRHDFRVPHAVIVGLGSGEHVRTWLEQHPDARVTVIDCREALVRPFRAGFPDIQSRVDVVIVDSLEGLFHHEILGRVAVELPPILFFRPCVGLRKDLFEEFFRALTGRSVRSLQYFLRKFGHSPEPEFETSDDGRMLTVKDLGVLIDMHHEGHPQAAAVRVLKELLI